MKILLKYLFILIAFTLKAYAATYTVDNTGDVDNGLVYTAGDGNNSLRKCIRLANANAGADIIDFNLGAALPYTITLTAALPDLTDNAGVTIDGWENGANDGTPNTVAVFNASTTTPMNANYAIILSNGANIPTGLILASNNNVIQGLVLQNFGDGTVSTNDVAITISGNSNQILGCIIGLNSLGTTRGTVTKIGIYITGNSNTIGSGTAAGANILSGMNSSGYGIYISGASATFNTIKGNMLGLQKDGTTEVSGDDQNSGVGIASSPANNTIGGIASGDGNVISGNTTAGITFSAASSGNNVFGNIIGLQANGATVVTSNSQDFGVVIGSTSSVVIGGNTVTDIDYRNIISGNTTAGISITGSAATNNSILGNYIGLQKNGTTIVTSSSQDHGVFFSGDAISNMVGGTVTGEGNLISGNTNSGIRSTSTSGNNVYGNIIGLQADGATVLASNPQTHGIYLNGSANNVIGGNTVTDVDYRNIISGNTDYGIYITGAAATNNSILGNYIGLQSNGTTILTSGSQDYGVYFTSGAISNTVGGIVTGQSNVISGNTNSGIYSNSASGNNVYGNIIGLQADGATVVASNTQTHGIYLSASPSNIIGGNTVTDVDYRNIISGNNTYGIYLTGAAATNNSILGNYIGPQSNGTSMVTSSSQDYGIYNAGSAPNNTIGGTAAGEANLITHNTLNGVYLTGASATGNKISGNSIHSNVGKPIELNGTGNNNKTIPTITSSSISGANGTAAAGDVIEVFSNQTTNCNDMVTYVGSATADGSGNWNIAFTLTAADYISASARDASNNTSEACNCRLVTLPIELIEFKVDCENQKVKVYWSTATETNNDYFTLERTSDGVNNKKEFVINSKATNGNSAQAISYMYTDDDPIIGVSYYRLKQTDYDGKFEYFDFVSVSCNDKAANIISVYPNPSNGSYIISGIELGAEVNITDLLGQSITRKIVTSIKTEFDLVNQPQGVYFVNIYTDKKVVSEKIIKN